MVNSIEGLRERVQGFTLEQVSEMDQRLRTMSLRLGELQRTVRALSEIKQQMSRLQKTVQQVEAESLEQGRLATLVEPIAVQSIAQVGTLLKFRRVIKLLKEAKSVLGSITVCQYGGQDSYRFPSPLRSSQQSPKNEQELGADLPAIEHDLPERSSERNCCRRCQ